MKQEAQEKVAYLKSIGLTAVAETIEETASLSDKLKEAYARYRYLTPSAIARFQGKLQEETRSVDAGVTSYKHLRFTRLEQYPKLPPDDVMVALEQAKSYQCFDYFEVADLETVKQYPDPLLLGCVNNCADKFFITQWDEDVKIQDLLQGDEGWHTPSETP